MELCLLGFLHWRELFTSCVKQRKIKMLANGAPPLHPLTTLKAKSIQTHSSSSCFVLCVKSNRRVFLGLPGSGCREKRFDPVAASSHLVDDDTDSYLPSPSNSVDAPAGSSAPSTGRLSGSFEKLKLQKLKVIAEKARLARREVKKYGNAVAIEDAIFDKSIGSDSEPDFSKSKKIVRGLRRERNTSRASHMQDIQDRMPTQREDVKYSSPRIKQVPGGSTSSFRGWGRGVRPEPIPVDSPVRQRKFSSDNEFFSRKSFKDLGCSEFMIEALRGQAFQRPSHIQAMAFAPVIDGRTCIIADQSGSGKTLAYLIPIIQRLRQGELQGLGEISTGSPQVFVMVPTAELASQVLNNCRQLSKFGVPFRSMVATGGFRQKTQLEALEQGVDVLIATPGRFMFLIKEGFLKIERLRCVVLDEVDILFNDEDFEVSMQSLINSAPVTTQYLFVTATLPVHVYNKLVEAFPDCEVAMGPGIHRTSNKLEEVLLDCSGESEAEKTPESAFDNKKSALLQLVEQSPVSKTIVFCNKIETCRKVENALKRFDRKGVRVQVLPFHAALAQEARVANMKEFMNSSPKGESLFLVCTDRASRGIDFTGVDHVVLFDFPRDPSEYVRRVGRTARGARGTGKAFIFAVGKQVSLARRIIERNQKGHPLHDVPAAYELIA